MNPNLLLHAIEEEHDMTTSLTKFAHIARCNASAPSARTIAPTERDTCGDTNEKNCWGDKKYSFGIQCKAMSSRIVATPTTNYVPSRRSTS